MFMLCDISHQHGQSPKKTEMLLRIVPAQHGIALQRAVPSSRNEMRGHAIPGHTTGTSCRSTRKPLPWHTILPPESGEQGRISALSTTGLLHQLPFLPMPASKRLLLGWDLPCPGTSKQILPRTGCPRQPFSVFPEH